MDAGHGGRSGHRMRGKETRGGGCQVEGVEEFHVEDLPCQERIWGAGVTEREGMRQQMADYGGVLGGGRMDEGN